MSKSGRGKDEQRAHLETLRRGRIKADIKCCIELMTTYHEDNRDEGMMPHERQQILDHFKELEDGCSESGRDTQVAPSSG